MIQPVSGSVPEDPTRLERLTGGILVVTPMQEELDWLVRTWTECGFGAQESSVGKLAVVQLPQLGITLARGGTGKAQFALQTQHLLDYCAHWDLVICAGAAGALADHLSVGDIVVATTTVEHDYRNKFNLRPVPGFDGAPAALAGLRCASACHAFTVYFGTVAGGDEDIVEAERRRSLRESTGALAVAWEGAGGARACAFSGVPFVEIRAVTDTANQDAPADFSSNLEVAMRNLGRFLASWIQDQTSL